MARHKHEQLRKRGCSRRFAGAGGRVAPRLEVDGVLPHVCGEGSVQILCQRLRRALPGGRRSRSGRPWAAGRNPHSEKCCTACPGSV